MKDKCFTNSNLPISEDWPRSCCFLPLLLIVLPTIDLPGVRLSSPVFQGSETVGRGSESKRKVER